MHTTSFVKNKFKNRMHKIGCFEKIKSKLKNALQASEMKDMEIVYKIMIDMYNDICEESSVIE